MNERDELAMLRRLAELEAKAKQQSYEHKGTPDDPLRNDPYWQTAQGQTWLENLAGGYAGSLSALPLGVRQMFGNAAPDEIKDWARSMRGLASTKSGMTGALAGAAAPAIALGMIPGGNTLLGAFATGFGLGGAQPVQEGETRLGNATKSALFNSALPAGLAAFKTGKAAVSPFTQGGREGIAGRTLERFATDKGSIDRGALEQWLVGQPTLAEASRDTGLANLQRTVQTMDPRGLVAQRYADNNAARVGALTSIAGDDAAMKAAEAARDAASKGAYQAADAGVAPVDGYFKGLLMRKQFSTAVNRAQELANNEGLTDIFFRGKSGEPVALLGQGAHYIKKALDEMGERSSAKYISTKDAASAANTQRQFLGWLDKSVPEYKQASEAFAKGSEPINQMEVARRLLDKHSSALRDFGGNPRLHAENFARAVQSEDALVKQATGLSRGLSDVMSPSQMKTIKALVDELSANSAAQAAGRAPGSPTAQYLMGQDVIGRIAGPLGVPKSFAGSTFVENALSRPVTWALKTPEEKLVGLLSEAMLDPKRAAELLKVGRPSPLALKSQRLLNGASPPAQGLLYGWPSIPALEQ